MIKNSALAERLNAFKTGETPEMLPQQTQEEQSESNEEIIEDSMKVQVGNYIIDLSFFVTKCVAFGYSLELILKTDWTFIPTIAIGFSIEVLSTKIIEAFHKT
jgi:Na+/glutamate symporter